MDQNEIPHDPRHLGVPSGAYKMISEPMISLAQTVHLSCVRISTKPPHLGVPSGASKTISEPMVCLAQTVHLVFYQIVFDLSINQLWAYYRSLGLLQPLHIPKSSWLDISMDFIEVLPKSKGYSIINVVVDWITKPAYFVPLSSTEFCYSPFILNKSILEFS